MDHRRVRRDLKQVVRTLVELLDRLPTAGEEAQRVLKEARVLYSKDWRKRPETWIRSRDDLSRAYKLLDHVLQVMPVRNNLSLVSHNGDTEARDYYRYEKARSGTERELEGLMERIAGSRTAGLTLDEIEELDRRAWKYLRGDYKPSGRPPWDGPYWVAQVLHGVLNANVIGGRERRFYVQIALAVCTGSGCADRNDPIVKYALRKDWSAEIEPQCLTDKFLASEPSRAVRTWLESMNRIKFGVNQGLSRPEQWAMCRLKLDEHLLGLGIEAEEWLRDLVPGIKGTSASAANGLDEPSEGSSKGTTQKTATVQTALLRSEHDEDGNVTFMDTSGDALCVREGTTAWAVARTLFEKQSECIPIEELARCVDEVLLKYVPPNSPRRAGRAGEEMLDQGSRTFRRGRADTEYAKLSPDNVIDRLQAVLRRRQPKSSRRLRAHWFHWNRRENTVVVEYRGPTA